MLVFSSSANMQTKHQPQTLCSSGQPGIFSQNNTKKHWKLIIRRYYKVDSKPCVATGRERSKE